MRLLLTRAKADAADTRKKLEAMGHEVLVSPLIEIVGTGAAWPSGVIDAVAATSAQAFAVDVLGLSPEARRLMPLFLVGQRTADEARHQGFAGSIVVAATAEALATAFGEPRARPRRLVYLAGRDRKPDLERALFSSEQSVEVLEVYAAEGTTELREAVAATMMQGQVDGVLHYSRRSASLFLDAIRKADISVTALTHFCLSEDVAEPLREAGCSALKVAQTPNQAALLALTEP